MKNKKFSQIFDRCEIQSVNNRSTEFFKDDDPLFFEEFSRIFKEFDLRGIKLASFMRLIDSVMPHDDECFCSQLGYKSAFIYVYKIRRKPNRKIYPESLEDAYFYHSKGWEKLTKHSIVKFDPRKTHALLNSFNLDLIVFWR